MSERAPVWIECEECHGEGNLPYPYDRKRCHDCGGRGGFHVSREVAERRYRWAIAIEPEAES